MKDKKNSELARIHIGAKQLGLDRDGYEDMLWVIARARSASDLDEFGRRKVLAHLRKCGAKFHSKGRPKAGGDKAPLLRKVYAMLGDRPASYAEGILRRMFGEAAPAKLEWASPEQLRKVVAALNYDKRRKG